MAGQLAVARHGGQVQFMSAEGQQTCSLQLASQPEGSKSVVASLDIIAASRSVQRSRFPVLAWPEYGFEHNHHNHYACLFCMGQADSQQACCAAAGLHS